MPIHRKTLVIQWIWIFLLLGCCMKFPYQDPDHDPVHPKFQPTPSRNFAMDLYRGFQARSGGNPLEFVCPIPIKSTDPYLGATTQEEWDAKLAEITAEMQKTSHMSIVKFHTNEPGAMVFYRLIASKKWTRAKGLTNDASEKIPVGSYFFVAQRHERPPSNLDLEDIPFITVFEGETTIDLEEK